MDNSTLLLETATFSLLDYSLFGLMLTISVCIGIYYGCFGTKQSTTDEYLLGGRTMNIFPVTMSLLASNLSGASLMGIPAEIYMHGTQYWACIFSALILALVMVNIFLPVFHKMQVNSAYEYLEKRFDRRVRKVATFVFTMNTILFVPIVIYVPSLAFNQVSNLDINIIAPTICLVCIFYTALGGLKGVVWSDTVQLCLTLCAMSIVLFLGITSTGGVAHIWEKAEESGRIEFFNFDFNPTTRATFWAITVGNTATWIAGVGVHQTCVQRYLALPSLKAAKVAAVLFAMGIVMTSSFSSFSGLVIYARYHDCDPVTSQKVKKVDQILPYYILDVASAYPGLSAIFVSGIFTTALSTMSTGLNTLAGTIFEDLIMPWKKEIITAKTANIIIRSLVVIIGLICCGLVFVVEHLGTILQIQKSFSGLTGGPLLGLFVLGALFPIANSIGAFYGCLLSFAVVAWICGGQQLNNARGGVVTVHKPLSIDGCGDSFNFTNWSNKTLLNDTTTQPWFLYRISFFWYTFIGLTVAVIGGLIISHFNRHKCQKIEDKKMFSPVIYRFLRKDETLECDVVE